MNEEEQEDYQDSQNKQFYGPYEQVRLKKHIQSDQDFSDNRRSSIEEDLLHNTDDTKPEQFLPLKKEVASKSNFDVSRSNPFHSINKFSLNGAWLPITHWTLRKYHPHSFSYHHHNAKFIS